MKRSRQAKWVDDIVESHLFLMEFPTLIQKENSIYGKLLFEENLISYNIISLIKLLGHAGNKFCGDQLLKSGFRITINTSELEKYTLGQLAVLLKKLLEKEKFYKKLDYYITMRNGITHKMLTKYESFKQLNADAERALIIGGMILADLNKISDDFARLILR